MNRIGESELILNPDGSIYHLRLKPENIADTIILVGDQSRVATVSKFFDKIDFQIQNREFITHTGTYRNKRLSVVSTGIGTDNVDIVVSELDALVNIDLQKREIKDKLTSLSFVRIGTSGALQEDLPVDSPVVSKFSIGIDGLLNFYTGRNAVADREMEEAFLVHTNWAKSLAIPYCIESSKTLFDTISRNELKFGITVSAPGFYGPQGRQLRLPPLDVDINEKLHTFRYKDYRISNFEMECSAIYGLSKLMGHDALTVCLIIANRIRKEFSKDYKPAMESLIKLVLDRLTD
jgi:uridine phosphorylase